MSLAHLYTMIDTGHDGGLLCDDRDSDALRTLRTAMRVPVA
jgi:hypothetical protein